MPPFQENYYCPVFENTCPQTKYRFVLIQSSTCDLHEYISVALSENHSTKTKLVFSSSILTIPKRMGCFCESFKYSLCLLKSPKTPKMIYVFQPAPGTVEKGKFHENQIQKKIRQRSHCRIHNLTSIKFIGWPVVRICRISGLNHRKSHSEVLCW